MEQKILTGNEGLRSSYWTKKWGITNAQLNEAILQTGSLETKAIRNYLRKRCDLRRIADWMSYFRLSF